VLEEFALPTWKYHNPVQGGMMRYASAEAKVLHVSYFHGGDVLYELDKIPGTWHEGCLERVDDGRDS